MARAWLPRLAIVAAALLVVAAYVFFATAGSFDFRRAHVDDNYRALANAYLHRQLFLLEQPDPRLAALDNPYDLDQRRGIPYRWDNSYFNGRYYLYFTPLPALTIYAPWHVLTGRFPSPALAVVVLAVAAWLFQAKALSIATAPHLLGGEWRAGWLLLLGLANLVPYTLLRPDVYELAVMSGYACSSAFLCAAAWLWFRAPTPAAATLAGLACAASIAARPSLAPLLVVLCACAASIWLRRPEQRLRLLACLAAPLVLGLGAMAWHNATRFGSAFESGMSFMLSSADHRAHRVCSPVSLTGWARALNAGTQYLASVPALDGFFPFLRLRAGAPLPADAASLRLPLEDVAGLLWLFPVLPLGLAALAWAARAPEQRRMVSFAGVLAACAAAIALAVGTCWFVVIRYQLDFWPPIAVAGALGLHWLATVARHPWQRAGLVGAVSLGALVGVLLGMSGNGDLFRARSPELFERLAGALSPSALLEFPRRLGCYRLPFRDLGGQDHSVAQPLDDAQSPEACSQRCRAVGARYATALKPGQCACSNVLAHRGRSRAMTAEPWIAGRNVDYCQRPCAGDPSRTCGTTGYGDVFMLRP